MQSNAITHYSADQQNLYTGIKLD